MPKHKLNALLTLVLAILFFLFFDVAKHNTILSQANPFAEDPYDAVGSFAIQLAMLAALISLVRAFRLYPGNIIPAERQLLIARGEYLACLSVAVTLAADMIAMLRHIDMWVGNPGGKALVALLGGMALVVAFVGWLVYRSAPRRIAPASRTWLGAIAIGVTGILVLAAFPEWWRERVPTEIVTVLVGALFLFLPVRAFAMALAPDAGPFTEDFLDDLAVIFAWLRAHAGPLRVLFRFADKLLGPGWVRQIVRWFNPRRHAWTLVILIGLLIGAALVLAEMLFEGGPGPLGRMLLVAALFLGLEGAAVVMGYALLARPLALFRYS